MQKKENEITLTASAMENFNLNENESQLNEEQKKELDALYGNLEQFQVGKIVKGKIISNDEHGILVDIQYKSYGLISNQEFSTVELKRLTKDNEIEVVIDQLEDEYGNVILSYQKAKAIKTWDKIAELATKDEPVHGVVMYKVKGGLSVDIGIPAFLPGSQVDVQRVTNFDQFVGQEITCKIIKVNRKRGNVIISRRKFIEEQRSVDRKKALEGIQEEQIIQGIVKNITNYGVFVDIGGIDGLLHITDMSWGRVNHPSELVKIGDKITVKVLLFDKEREKISLGMKQLSKNPWEDVADKYAVGNTIKGRISSITDYGLFVEIEKGIEGLVHISEISWTNRITNLSKHYNVSNEIEAKIVSLDIDNRRMSLSIKQLEENPWEKIALQLKSGDKIKGEISNITDFGLFVRIDDTIDGLVHISDLSWTDHISHPSEIYKKGDAVEAQVLSIDPENRKISLGIKQLQEDPWEQIEEKYPEGKIIEGVVAKITNFGAFIKLSDGIEGLVHISELSDKEVSKVEDVLKEGETVKFKIIKVNKDDRKLGLSLKALSAPEESKETQKEQSPKEEKKKKKKNHFSKKTTHKTEKSQSSFNNPLQQALAKHSAKLKEKKATEDKEKK